MARTDYCRRFIFLVCCSSCCSSSCCARSLADDRGIVEFAVYRSDVRAEHPSVRRSVNRLPPVMASTRRRPFSGAHAMVVCVGLCPVDRSSRLLFAPHLPPRRSPHVGTCFCSVSSSCVLRAARCSCTRRARACRCCLIHGRRVWTCRAAVWFCVLLGPRRVLPWSCSDCSGRKSHLPLR